MELEFRICNQSLKRTDENKPADLSNEYLTCKFNFFTEDWDEMGKFAIFRCDDKTYREAIIDDECIVPFDALKSDKFILTIYGVNEDVRITTNYVWVTLKRSAFVDKYDESSYFNPDMTEELFDAVEQKVYTSRFIETIEDINDDISGLSENKVDKTDYNVDLENINNAITDLTENKVDESTFLDAVGNINSNIDSINDDVSGLSENKVDKVTGKQLSTNDFNNDYKSELDNLPANLNSKVDVSEYNETTTDIYNQLEEHTHSYDDLTDKPFIPSKTSDLNNDVPFLTEHQDISGKADKSYVDVELNKKANSTEVYTKSDVDELIHNLQNNIKLNGTSGIIQTDESVELYAYCKADGMPCINKKVHFYEIMED